ncbi:5-oxoprolinase subunit PxpA [bacterium]|nr:5-oxoprolinase subunit PxpA [bacterium]
MAVKINCDMGESFGIYKLGDDEALMAYIDAANVACGFHASDPVVMQNTVSNAKENGVSVGAHPSLPDLQGFGRREMKMDPAELKAHLIYQVSALKGFLDVAGMSLSHIKPHGSLYGMAARMPEITHAVCDVAELFKVPLYGMADTLHEEIAAKRGIEFLAEFYADLDYSDEGGLIITREHTPVDIAKTLAKVERAIREGRVFSVNGKDLKIKCDTICVHSDTPNAVELATKLKPLLEKL